MAKTKKLIRRSARYTAKEFEPYVKALGQLNLAWNDLQEMLSGLFWTIMNKRPPAAGDFVDYTPLLVWHSSKSDRAQREMLKSAVKFQSPGGFRPDYWKRPQLVADVTWILDRCDELENARNDAIHSPLFSTSYSLWGGERGATEPVRPATWQFNPRALNLNKRENLLKEFRYCRDMAIFLADYALAIDRALIHPAQAWPKKPSPPTRGRKTNRPDHRPLPQQTK